MKITPHLFEAFLKCPTKCWLRSQSEPDTGNEYTTWFKSKNESYRIEGVRRLIADIPPDEYVTSPPEAENLKAAKWRFAVDFFVHAQDLESTIHLVEQMPSEGRGKAKTFVPIRFVFTNKLTRDDKLLVAFDALVFSEMLGRGGELGKIIHGDNHITLKVNASALAAEVRKRTERIAALLSSSTPPDLVLNRHCGECEFQTRCRDKAVEKDDLSLLSGMGEKERKELHSKGIFTVTQLSYTFRPRRRPKRLRDRKEKYHHSLKALAIREKKIHVVGTPELKIDGTPVYLDVEGLPDRDFYYLIGVRIGNGETAVQHSLWADTVEDEGRIWRDFLAVLEAVEKPVLIHYGSYEKTFLKAMAERFGRPPDGSAAAKALAAPVNVLSVIFAQIYFPTYSNGLKEVAGGLGYQWSEHNASGLWSVTMREAWTRSKASELKKRLIRYNAEDCEALVLVEQGVTRIGTPVEQPMEPESDMPEVVRTDELRHPLVNKWDVFKSPLPDLEAITNAAHWDYQRDRIYVRTSKRVRRRARPRPSHDQVWQVDKTVREEPSHLCPRCGAMGVKRGGRRRRRVQEMLFGRFSLKRRVTLYDFQPYWCHTCQILFGVDPDLILPEKRIRHSRSLLAFMFYQVVELYTPMQVVAKSLNRLFGLDMSTCNCKLFKERLAEHYAATQQQILNRIVNGPLVHADETHFRVLGKPAYVWVFTNMHEVAYVFSETREGGLAQATLDKFKGVLVSDFYTVYDSLSCPQQKCLIHLIRDLNGAILDNPYDQELKQMVTGFGDLLKRIVQEIERRGLKKHFLRKYLHDVRRFYRELVTRDYQSPAALACVDRFERNRGKLFTFLEYDGVPWNNNNAEHAMKAFARLRDVIEGMSNEKGLKEYLVLLSICQTCKYSGVDFLDFLRSGETDIEAFAESKRRRRGTITAKPQDLKGIIGCNPAACRPRAA